MSEKSFQRLQAFHHALLPDSFASELFWGKNAIAATFSGLGWLVLEAACPLHTPRTSSVMLSDSWVLKPTLKFATESSNPKQQSFGGEGKKKGLFLLLWYV